VEQFVRHLEAVWVNPEAAPLLTRLQQAGVKLALVTNTIEPLASQVIDHAQLGGFFAVRATADKVPQGKPAPDLIDFACAQLGVSPRDVWMVGDSAYDRGAAKAAGSRFVGLRLDGDVRIEQLAHFPGP
jgi:phosphoglycolate phosphatase/AHBA synthesis associated protein